MPNYYYILNQFPQIFLISWYYWKEVYQEEGQNGRIRYRRIGTRVKET